MKKIVLTYGLIAGGVLAGVMLITMPFHDAIGFDGGMIVGYTSMVMAFLLIYFGVRSYRDQVGAGRISFGRALSVGALIALVASLCYVAAWEALYYGGKNDYVEKYQAHELEKARASGRSETELAAMKREMDQFAQMYRNPLVNVAITLIEPLPVGLVFALLSAGILSRKRREEPGGLRVA